METEFDLQRFVSPHRRDFDTALREIQDGSKESHWMWYIFPQVRGLGHSFESDYYGIGSLDEAAAFLADPYLGDHLCEICEALLELETCSAREVFGCPDNMKLQSSMTLFAQVGGGYSVFQQVLDKFFDGQSDGRTLRFLNLSE